MSISFFLLIILYHEGRLRECEKWPSRFRKIVPRDEIEQFFDVSAESQKSQPKKVADSQISDSKEVDQESAVNSQSSRDFENIDILDCQDILGMTPELASKSAEISESEVISLKKVP